ncbi:MAG: cyclic pyranopterin monophosphate synthase MoaC [Planctomycetota bacterium]
MSDFSHLDSEGRARMVDVTAKDVTARKAVAHGFVHLKPETLRAIQAGQMKKGNVIETARLAGVQAAKRTWELIPLCHAIQLTHVRVDIEEAGEGCLEIRAEADAADRTGVEMEALTAVSVAALTLYDMCKAVDRGLRIDGIELLEKSGGRSGTWKRDSSPS